MSANLLTLRLDLSLIVSKAMSKIDNSSLNTTHSARNLDFTFDEHLTFSDQIASLSHTRELQQIQNCLARTVVKAPKFSHITPILDLCTGSTLMNALNIIIFNAFINPETPLTHPQNSYDQPT